MSTQQCPVCFMAVPANPRYQRYLCSNCAARAVSADGRALTFHNEGIWGGFVASHADDGSPYESHTCYVDGLRCHADEARFGGIVIEAAPMTNGPV